MTGTGTRVATLHRHPVKSLLGEQVERLEVDLRGCTGDRAWAVVIADGRLGSGKGGRRFRALPGLQLVRARTVGERVVLTLPDGVAVDVADPEAARLLSAHVGAPVSLATEGDGSHFDDGPVSLLGTGSVAAVAAAMGAPVAAQRFRANLVLATDRPWVEDAWQGRRLRVGGALLDVVATSPRCVMVDAATADRPAQPSPGCCARSAGCTRPSSASSPTWSGPGWSRWATRSTWSGTARSADEGPGGHRPRAVLHISRAPPRRRPPGRDAPAAAAPGCRP